MSWEIIRCIDGTGRVQMCESKEVAEGFLSTYPEEERKNYHIREYKPPKKLFKPPGECMNTSAEENKRMRGRIARKRREAEL